MLPLALILMLSAVLFAQDRTSNTLSADLSRYYFKSPEQEVSARVELNTALDQIAKLKSHVNSPTQLLSLLQGYEDVQKLFAKHEAYLHLRCALNRKDTACDADQKLESEVGAKTAFFNPEILGIPEDRLRKFLNGRELQKYGFAIAAIRRDSAHTLPEPEQALLDEFQPQIGDWQYDLYQQIVAGIPFGVVQSPAGALDVIRQRNLIATNTDGHVREEGFKKRLTGFASQRDLLAFSLTHTVQTQNALAKAHHYPDAPSRKYESLYFKPEETRNLLAQMALRGDIPKRYEKIRSRDIEQGYHQPAHAWDMSAPAPQLALPTISLAEAREVFHRAFAGFGAEYQAAFDALLDPSIGRADIVPGGAPNRYLGGFSVGFAGSSSILFYGRYDGTFKDLSGIAHEGGHAVHRQLMNANGVLPSYARGPHFLFESFAVFNELLLADYMANRADTPELQRYYREQWMNIKGLDAFYGADDALLEQAIYDGVAAGTIRNADDLDQLTLKIDGQFSQFPASTPEWRSRWAVASLMYEDPLYNVNYVYGGLLALKYFQLYSTRREWFVPRYVALLKNGFDETPQELLKRFLQIDFSDSSLLKDDLELLNRRLDDLEADSR